MAAYVSAGGIVDRKAEIPSPALFVGSFRIQRCQYSMYENRHPTAKASVPIL